MSTKLFLFVPVVVCNLVGCLPSRGTMPTQTWRPEEPEETTTCTADSLSDPTSTRWTHESSNALENALAKNEDADAVVSALGCRVNVLDHCHYNHNGLARPDIVLSKNLVGECLSATHVVRSARSDEPSPSPRVLGERVQVLPLSIDGFNLTGTWHGSMRQPHGPYEVYDTTMELVQEGNRVSGITRLATIDGVYWGDLRFEGRLEGNTIFFADAEVIDDNLGVFLAWCRKGGYLLVDPRDEWLRGPWRASLCAPGTMDVHFVGENHHVLANTIPR